MTDYVLFYFLFLFQGNSSSTLCSEVDPLCMDEPEKTRIINSIGPEISIIPVIVHKNKPPSFKIKLFEREYSPSKDDSSEKVHSIAR